MIPKLYRKMVTVIVNKYIVEEYYEDYKELGFYMLRAATEDLSANVCCVGDEKMVKDLTKSLKELAEDIEVDEVELTDVDYLVTLNAGRINIDRIYEETVFDADIIYYDDKYYKKFLDGCENDECLVTKYAIN